MAQRAMFIDVDGTLADTNAAHVRAWEKAFIEHGYKVAADRIAQEIGKGGDFLVPDVLGDDAEKRDGKKLRKTHDKIFLEDADKTTFPLFANATEFIAAVRSRGLLAVIVTSSSAKQLAQVEKSTDCDLGKLVDLVVNGDDAAAGKPAPDLMIAALKKAGVTAMNCVMLGDTPFDALSARDAGLVCLGVLSGGNTAERLLAAGCRRVYKDTADLLEHLDDALREAWPSPKPCAPELPSLLMDQALAMAREALAAGQPPIGSVVARGDGTIIGRGYNRQEAADDRTAHAEIVALRNASKNVPMDARDLILVSTLEPCVMCMGAAMELTVDTVIYGMAAPLDGGTKRISPPQSPENTMPRIIGGVKSKECRALLAEFLKSGKADARQKAYLTTLLET